MRVALCQLNPKVGAIAENTAAILRYAREAFEQGAVLMVAPELSVCGYPPKDMLFMDRFSQLVEKGLDEIAANTPIPVIVGAPLGRPAENAAIWCEKGKWRKVAAKTLLPNYDVFDERRFFEPAAHETEIIEFQGYRLGISICEDAWNDELFWPNRRYKIDPCETLAQKGANVMIHLMASPFELGKPEFRTKMFAHAAKRFGMSWLAAGQVGANDHLVFDGGSGVINELGEVKGSLEPFSEGLLLYSLLPLAGEGSRMRVDHGSQQSKLPLPTLTPPLSRQREKGEEEWLTQAITIGIRDYVNKTGAPGVLIGLSGGIDSALVAALAVNALGPNRVIGVRMPSQFSSSHSLEDAMEFANGLQIDIKTVEIEPCVQAFRDLLSISSGVADQNIQARVRGVALMGMSNVTGNLVLATSNKSELAMGYCTLYGDMCGALAPIGDVYKTQVWQLARYLKEQGWPIPQRSIDKTPSAELKPDQSDQDTLPPYDQLDAALEQVIGHNTDVGPIGATVQAMQFKRSQAPVILKVSQRALGDGYRWPIVKKTI